MTLVRDACALLRRPLVALKRRLVLWREAGKYRTRDGYDARRYWADRHERYGMDLRGAGHKSFSHEENARMYEEARRVFLEMCRRESLDLRAARVLDIGCGPGFYAQCLREQGCADYTGVDITDQLFSALQQAHPGFRFLQVDVSSEPLQGAWDLIVMIDVTQHITHPEKFAFAMRNVRSAMAPGGVFLVTSWLGADAARGFYEVSRSLATYQREFPGWQFSQPVAFRDKYLFSIRSPR